VSNTDSTRKCLQCGAPVTAADPRSKYCSRKCAGLARRTHDHAPVRECEQCGESFGVKDPKRRNRFCSVACASANQWTKRERMAKRTRECDFCGKTYEYVYRANRPHKFCTYECFTESKRAKAPKESPKNGFVQADDGQWWYFWADGKHRTRAYEKNCEWCGKSFIAATGRKAPFCSRECSGSWKHSEGLTGATKSGEGSPQWRGGHLYYRGPNWSRQRAAARRRDDNTCQDCGLTREEHGRELEVHHIIPFRHFGIKEYERANELPNLISLCRPCHLKREAVRDILFK
jgi:endogenous inhibitor of DNA gyrase (YacG/DUF329 family)